MGVFYDTLIVSRSPQRFGPPTLEIVDRVSSINAIAWSDELVGDNLGRVDIDVDNISPAVGERFTDLANNPCELWIYREDQLVHAGPIIGLQVQNNTIGIVSRGPLYYTKYMYIDDDYVHNNKDQFVIFKELIDLWQNEDYGNFGLNTSNIGTSGTIRPVEFYDKELRNVRREIEVLAQLERGFDFYVDYTTATLGENATKDIVLVNRRGTNKRNDVILDRRNLTDLVHIWMSVATEDIATWVKVLGTSQNFAEEGKTRRATSPALMQKFGRAGAVAHIDGILGVETTQEYANRARDLLSDFHMEIGGKQQGVSIFSIAGSTPADFGAGDTISFYWDAGFGDINQTRDVVKKFVSVDKSGTERMTVEVENVRPLNA